MQAHLRFLADDVLAGRAPGTTGAAVAAAYIAAQFELAGLEPAAPDGSFFQPVSLVGVTAEPSLVIGVRRLTTSLRNLEDFVAWPEQPLPSLTVDGEMVFVGYGIQAREWQWDDYKGTSLTGKILLMLANDPGLSDTSRFDGKSLTQYGHWAYKLAQAAREGAAGVVLIHSDESVGAPWSTVRNTWSGERVRPDMPIMETLRFGAWMTEQAAREVLAGTGRDFDLLVRRAQQREFRPIELDAHVVLHIRSEIRRFRSRNVIARIPGSDSRRNEAVLLTAHYDHLGIRHPVDGDSIYNGALDNGSGVAALLQMAGGLAQAGASPRRSILFLAATGGEGGYLGAEAFVREPSVPLENIAAAVNLYRMNLWGATRDAVALGAEHSSLADYFERAAAAGALEAVPDPYPEAGRFWRSDHLAFARAGVPSVSLAGGVLYLGQEPDWGLQRERGYVRESYHQPSDEFNPDFDYEGAIQQLRLLLRMTWELANAADFPAWSAGSQFRPAGEQLRLRRLRAPR
jgi:Zn-dependent M28 family amino/carboxypeptidase